MAKDPYKYFRIEAREIITNLNEGFLALEKNEVGADQVKYLLRLAHTLKGAARVVKQSRIAELSHDIEEVLGQIKTGARPESACMNTLLAQLDEASQLLALLDAAPADSGVPAEVAKPAAECKLNGKAQNIISEPSARHQARQILVTPPQTGKTAAESATSSFDNFSTMRVEAREMDVLLEGIAEMSIHIGALAGRVVMFERCAKKAKLVVQELTGRKVDDGYPGEFTATRAVALAEELAGELAGEYRKMESDVHEVEREISQLRHNVSELRLLPVATVFADMERSARDAAQSLGKNVTFSASGGEVRLDAPVLSSLRKALLHLIRNAVAHGIESAEVRARSRKPFAGRIELAVRRQGNHVLVVCRDDGQGIDLDAVRNVALKRGILSAEAAQKLSSDEAAKILLRGGLSTTAEVDFVSGRGVGLDVVAEVVRQWKGEIAIRSQPGQGMQVEIQVPVSLSSVTALAVESSGVVVWLPLDSVVTTFGLSDKMRESEDSVVFKERVLPFASLHRLLGVPAGRYRSAPDRTAVASASVALIVESLGTSVAIGVDRLLDIRNVVMRPLPRIVGDVPTIAGGTFDSDGHPQWILDPKGVVEAAGVTTSETRSVAETQRLPILVIDDSLTTRMLEQSILECAGYEVDLAASAEEGLERARARTYGLILCDVEMPGMNGFEFVAVARKDPELQNVPAILVTSRGSADDRQRGKDAGAYAHIIKGEFDQGHLLRMVGKLIG